LNQFHGKSFEFERKTRRKKLCYKFICGQIEATEKLLPHFPRSRHCRRLDNTMDGYFLIFEPRKKKPEYNGFQYNAVANKIDNKINVFSFGR
jgi:hypothetical protein